MNLKVSVLTISGIILSSSFLFSNPVSSQSFASDSLDCIKKFTDFYLSAESGFVTSNFFGSITREERQEALKKAEAKCEMESRRQPNNSSFDSDRFDSDREDRRSRRRRGGDPQAIQQCMNGLLYARRPVCTRSSCARLSTPEENANSGFGGWQWQTVRTETSESTAADACRNAR